MNQGITDHFKHKVVRDLAWVIGSPPLMHPSYTDSSIVTLTRKWCSSQLELHSEWLVELDQNPSPLVKSLTKQKRFRLGKYFEELVLFWITESPHFEPIASGLQIVAEGKTIGEADILLRNTETRETQHWELAVKYYLCEGASETWSQWIGPNPTDTLEKKMRTLIDKQLTLFQNATAKEALSELGIDTVAPCLFLKGYFFSEFSSAKVMRPRDAAQPLNGWWCKNGTFSDLSQSSSTWAVLEKEWWLAPVMITSDELVLYNSEEIVQVVANVTRHGKSVLCTPLQQQGEFLVEQFKLFVVPDQWPKQ